MKTRLAAALAGLAALLAAGLVGVAPAQATSHVHASAAQVEPVCATWTMRGATGAYPDVEFGAAPAGSTVADYFAKLTKPSEGIQPGVEFAAFDLDIEAPADNELLVGVDYATADGATTAAGAIRLFGYAGQDADTLNDAPTYGPAVAASESGHLVLTIPAGEKLGTLGVVFDASNSSNGSVTFSNLKIGTRLVKFTGCPEPEPTVTATPTAEPSGEPTSQPTGGATPEPSGTAAPVPTLPVTGSSSLVWLALAGACALGSGALLMVLARRRRTSFEV